MSVVYMWSTFTGELALEPTDVQADGTDIAVDSYQRRIHLEGKDWATVELKLRASTSEAPPAGIDELAAHALASSPRSALRRPFPLVIVSEHGPTAVTGTVSLSRADLAGAVEVTVFVTGIVGGRRRVVGASGSWTIVVDASEAPKPPGAPPFKFKRQNFSAPDAPLMVREHSLELAYFELSDPPVLWVNDGIDGLWALLHASHAKDDRRRQRDAVSATIARVVVSTVFRSAGQELVIDGDDEPSRQIQRDVCARIAAHIPDANDLPEFYEAIKKVESLDRQARDRFWGHIDLALDHISGLSTALARNIREVKRG